MPNKQFFSLLLVIPLLLSATVSQLQSSFAVVAPATITGLVALWNDSNKNDDDDNEHHQNDKGRK